MTEYVITEEQLNRYEQGCTFNLASDIRSRPLSDVIKQYDKDTIAELERKKGIIIDYIKRDPHNESFVRMQESKWNLIIEEIMLVRNGVKKE